MGERAGLVGLAAFLAVDVLLVAMAVSSTREPVAAGGTRVATGSTTSSSSSSSGASGASSGTSGASGSSTTAGPAIEVVPLTVGLTAVSGSTALLFTTGRCDSGGADLALTSDGGKTWDSRKAPFDVTVRVRVRSDRSAFAVGADKGGQCSPRIRQAGAFDGDFGQAQPSGDVWFRDPRRADSVGLPSGGTAKPCGSGAVVDLSVIDTGAALLCDDGRVLTSGTGSTWERKADLAAGLAVAQTASGRVLVAATGVGDCDGIAVVDAKDPKNALGCAELDVAGVTPGTVAVSVTSDSGWLAVGKDSYRSDGSFSTWKKS